MFRYRLGSTLLLLFLLFAAIFLPFPGLTALFVITIIGMALYEFFHMVQAKGYPVFKWYGIVWGTIIVGSQYILYAYNAGSDAVISFWLTFIGGVILLFTLYILRKENNIVLSTGLTLLGVTYVGILFLFIIWIRYSFGSSEGKWLALFLICVTKASDIAAYIGGTCWGKHKLVPRISANKTIEGSVLGLAGGFLMGLLLIVFTPVPHKAGGFILLSILLAITGQVGDLAESLIKRDLDVKDSGKIIPGIGGVLDILDSLLFSSPLMYLYLRIFMK